MADDVSSPVLIVGGGFSGAMLAARLAERGVAARLIGRDPAFGLGVAYSTPFDGHLLNVRSARMSAVEGRPDDFVDWLKANRAELADPDDFAPRRVYGDYVRARLAAVEAAHPDLIERIVGDVAGIDDRAVRLSDGRRLQGRAVVLATGNPAPATTRGADGRSRVIPDPWAPGALAAVGVEDTVLIVGSGLTMVDMLQMLEGQGWRGRAAVLSRRGLLPRTHEEAPEPAAALPPAALEGPASQRLHAARRAADAVGWRHVMEGYRPITAALWAETPVAVRARLVRHLRPWWDVHRHRIAPRIGRFLGRLASEGRLTVHAGRLGPVEARADGVRAGWSPRGGGEGAGLSADWMIDCTGPGHDAARDALTGPLIAAGRARLDALRLGLDLDPAGRVLDAEGRADPALFVLGPPARAAFWETIAVPDIRKRIEAMTDALAA